MCGIAGSVGFPLVPAVLETLRHRGPDDEGVLDLEYGGRRVVLYHTRLSILDLSPAGHQPMETADGSLSIVFNGEIYNYEELRARFLRDAVFRSRTDTEVLMQLYEHFGTEAFAHLNGDFALALFDRRKGELLLVRDRFGVKPLYVCAERDRFAFASELKAFRAMGCALSLDEEQLPAYLAFKYFPGDLTPFREVRRLMPGTYMRVDLNSGRSTTHTYWTLADEDFGRDTAITPTEARDRLDDLLGAAVRRRLHADVPVGVFLSGGIDSSTIAHYARGSTALSYFCARKTRRDILREGTGSDYTFAERLAEEWDLRLQPIDIDAHSLTPDLVSRTLQFSDDLIADASQIPTFLITAACKPHATVMLSGMGGDELFLGYGGHLLARLAGHLDRVPRVMRAPVLALLRRLRSGGGAFQGYKRFLLKLGRYYDSPDWRYGAFAIVGDLRNAMRVHPDGTDVIFTHFQRYFSGTQDPFVELTQFERGNFLVKNLHYTDRMCMAHGVEARVPFLDHELAEFVWSLPLPMKLTATGRTKVLLKDMAARHLPAYIINRRKAGFGMPLRSILSDRAKLEELLDPPFFASRAGFDMQAIDRMIDLHLSHREDTSTLLYALISFRHWHHVHLGS